MTKYLALALFLLAVPSHAATITFTVTTIAGGTVTNTYTITEGQAGRLIAAYKARLGQVPSGPPVDGVTPMRDRTNAEIAKAWFDSLIGGTIDGVRQFEQDTAAKTARDAIVLPVPTSP